MAEAGGPIEEIAQYLGQSNPGITRSTYGQFHREYLRKSAGALSLGGRLRFAEPKSNPRRGDFLE